MSTKSSQQQQCAPTECRLASATNSLQSQHTVLCTSGSCRAVMLFLVVYAAFWLFTPNAAYKILSSEFCGNQTSGECTSALATLHEYCGTTAPSGLDGLPPDEHGGWSLKHVMFLVRHGDENPPSPPKNSTTVIHSHHWKELEDDPAPYMRHLADFDVKEIERGVVDNSKMQPGSFFNRAVPAQLTKRGFMQNIKSGEFLARRYAPLLNLVTDPQQVYVRSTRSGRAVQVCPSQATNIPISEGCHVVTALSLIVRCCLLGGASTEEILQHEWHQSESRCLEIDTI